MKHEYNPQANGAFDIMIKSFSRQCLMPGVFVGLSVMSQAFAATEIPTGTLNVDRALVMSGARVQLNWKINYPVRVTDLVDIIPPNSITPKQDMTMRVRVVGFSFLKGKSNNGHGNNLDGVDCSNPGKGGGGPNGLLDPSGTVDDEIRSGASYTIHAAEVMWSINYSSWQSLYYCTQDVVPSCDIVLDTPVKLGDIINFGTRAFEIAWLPIHHTAVSSPYVVILKNGDPTPAIPAFQTKLVKNYLFPYLTSDHMSVKIGNNEFLILFELDHANPDVAGFDLQDLAVLVTFE